MHLLSKQGVTNEWERNKWQGGGERERLISRRRCRDGGGWHQAAGEGRDVDRGIDGSCGDLGCPLRRSEHRWIHAGASLVDWQWSSPRQSYSCLKSTSFSHFEDTSPPESVRLSPSETVLCCGGQRMDGIRSCSFYKSQEKHWTRRSAP